MPTLRDWGWIRAFVVVIVLVAIFVPLICALNRQTNIEIQDLGRLVHTGPPGPTGATGSGSSSSSSSSQLEFNSNVYNLADGNILGDGYVANLVDEFAAAKTMIANATLGPMRVRLTSIPGLSNSRTFTLRRNGISTPLFVTLADTDTEGISNVTIAVVAGDQISLQHTISGTPIASLGSATVQMLQMP